MVVIQPAAVYGPRGADWTIDVIEQLSNHTLILINGDVASHNFVYVDDVVQALLLAAVQDGLEGQSFIIAGPDSILVRDFFAAYESMLGIRSTVTVSADELAAARDLRSLVREKGDSSGKSPEVMHSFDKRTDFLIGKAKRLLGYQPRFGFQEGMRLTEQWARQEGLLAIRK